jgi:hypothetical protein
LAGIGALQMGRSDGEERFVSASLGADFAESEAGEDEGNEQQEPIDAENDYVCLPARLVSYHSEGVHSTGGDESLPLRQIEGG